MKLLSSIRLVTCISICFLAATGEGTVRLVGSNVSGVVSPPPTQPVVIYCDIDGTLPVDQTYQLTWTRDGEGLITYNNDVVFKGYQSRLTVTNSPVDESRLSLEINPVQLSDAGKYDCSIVGLYDHNLIASSYLSVNQLPNVTAKVNELTVIEGNEVILGTCFANSSKPTPEVWIEDSLGNRIDSLSSVTVVDSQEHQGISDSVLKFSKVFDRSDNSKSYHCVVQHPDRLESYSAFIGEVDVQFPPTVEFMATSHGEDISMQEEQPFNMECLAGGNPQPQVVWTFQADDTQTDTNSVDVDTTIPTDPPSTDLPSEFQAS
uniref:Ig-like domain-containing protein n=1 Tax=Ciona savignyi TaxID=51511 RepID=H2YV15_CIOSA